MCVVTPCHLPQPDCTKNTRVRRGTKAGRRFIRHINTISVRQPRLTKQQVLGVNTDNLVFIPTDKTHEARPILTLVNHRSLKKCTIRNINTSNLKPVPKIKHHTCDGYMSLASLNCRSVVNKTVAINDYIVSNNIDLLAFTETWLGKEKKTMWFYPNLHQRDSLSCKSRENTGEVDWHWFIKIIFHAVTNPFPPTFISHILSTWSVQLPHQITMWDCV